MKVLASVYGFVATVTIVCMAAGHEGGKPDNQDMESLQGAWRAVKGPGGPKTDERAKNITFVVKGDKTTMIDSNPDQKSEKAGTSTSGGSWN